MEGQYDMVTPPNAANPVKTATHLNHCLKVSGSCNHNFFGLTKPKAPDRVARALVTMAQASLAVARLAIGIVTSVFCD